MTPTKRLSIIILSYNTKNYLAQALLSIKDQLTKDWEVIVVDNNSTDGSSAMVKKEFGFAELIQNKANLGFAGGNNIGIGRAHGEYVMLLNSDAELLPDNPLDTLLEYLDAHPRVAAITPRVTMPDGSIDLGSHRGIPTPWNAFTYFTGLEKLFGRFPMLNRVLGGYHQTWKNYNRIHEIDACSCAAIIVRGTAIQEVGMLDERFFMYAEDLDWCVRFREAGWKVIYHPEVRVLHHKNKSGIHRETHESEEHLKTKRRAHAHFFDTMIQFYEKHYLVRYPKWIKHIVYAGIRTMQHMKGAHHADSHKETRNAIEE